MTIGDAFTLLIPALLLLLAVGAFAPQIEQAVYRLYSDEEGSAAERSRAVAEIARLHAERGRQLADLRAELSRLDDRIADLQRERAGLLAQEKTMGDAAANFVAEAGYPTAASQGFYFKFEGPAKEMPFAGLASVATSLSGRRQARIVVWGLGPAEAQNFATNWAGENARMLTMRPFAGRLFWLEV
ncbi:hypothetical protein [Ferrovibrio sp.]|uniref:hypothetical protein n=1 Tax=Ferrovibrio sp. TaxID=1917215 RepID=UPI00311E9B36